LCRRRVRMLITFSTRLQLDSVPRSIEDPIRTNQANIDGFLNMLVAARDANVKRFVYAASSSTYGDHPDLPKVRIKSATHLAPMLLPRWSTSFTPMLCQNLRIQYHRPALFQYLWQKAGSEWRLCCRHPQMGRRYPEG